MSQFLAYEFKIHSFVLAQFGLDLLQVDNRKGIENLVGLNARGHVAFLSGRDGLFVADDAKRERMAAGDGEDADVGRKWHHLAAGTALAFGG